MTLYSYPKIFRSISQQQTKYLFAVGVVSILMFIGTLLASHSAKFALAKKQESFFIRQADLLVDTYHTKLSSYTTILDGFQGLWYVQGDYDYQSFHQYTGSLSPDITYNAGISSFIYLKAVPKKDRLRFERAIKNEENIPTAYSSYRISPDSPAEILYPVVYAEPIDGREAALGRDSSVFPERLSAIEYSRDHNALSTFPPTNLITTGEAGFFLLMPLYDPGSPIENLEQRRMAFRGIIAIGFRSRDAFAYIFGGTEDHFPLLDFQVYQGTTLADKYLLYDHDISFTAQSPDHEISRIVEVQGQAWTVKVQSKPALTLADKEAGLPLLIMLSGFVVTILIVSFSLIQSFRFLRNTD